MEDKSIKKD